MTPPSDTPEVPTEDQRLEHALYHVLVGRLETYFDLDPCPAIKASGELTYNLVRDARSYLTWLDEAGDI